MKIGVTGGAGFIGGWVAAVALERGHSVVVMDRRRQLGGVPSLRAAVGAQEAEQLPHLGRLEVFHGDVRDETAMCELAAHVDGVIHLAACLGTQETIQNPRPALETNTRGGLNFLEAVAQYGIAGVYIGVGNHWMDNTYSISKTTVERFCRMFNAERGTKVNVVRLVNAYGPGQSVAPPYGPAKVRKITPSFIARALTGAPIEVYGDGQQISDMVHVRDGALALVTALEASYAGHLIPEPVEVGPVRSATVNEVAEQVVAAAANHGVYVPPTAGGPSIVHLPMRPGETPGAVVTADTSTLRHLGMDPARLTPLAKGMDETVAWYASHWLPEYRRQLQDDVRRAEASGS